MWAVWWMMVVHQLQSHGHVHCLRRMHALCTHSVTNEKTARCGLFAGIILHKRYVTGSKRSVQHTKCNVVAAAVVVQYYGIVADSKFQLFYELCPIITASIETLRIWCE